MKTTQVTFLKRLLLILLVLCAPGPTQAAQQSIDRGRYVLFIHAGPKDATDPMIKRIAGALVRSGYLVRAPDGQQDNVSGPGVDYFDDSAAPAAQDVARLMSGLLTTPEPLTPRLQRSKNPPTYLGVWLF